MPRRVGILCLLRRDWTNAKKNLLNYLEQNICCCFQDGLLDEEVFQNAQSTQVTYGESITNIQSNIDLLNNRMQTLLKEFSEEQARIKERLSRIEIRLVKLVYVTHNRHLQHNQNTGLACNLRFYLSYCWIARRMTCYCYLS